MPIENNTTTPSKDYPGTYLAGLVDVDCLKDKQELINAEYISDTNPTNSYWSGRVSFLKMKIQHKEELAQSLRDGTYININ